MTTYTITATAPTHYQYRSLNHFGMPITEVGDGSYTATMEFETEEQAKEYLRERAGIYDGGDNPEQLEEMLESIEHGVLHIDGATARIEQVEQIKDVKAIPGVAEQLALYNIWEQDNSGNLTHLRFTGTQEECEKEYADMEYSEPQQQICENNLVEQFEYDWKGKGYVEFGNKVIIWYEF